jgi:predicted membrane-bound spermidine synthase
MDDEIQFSTLDEHRYHDLLIPRHVSYGPSVLILGGGDGLALRNIYRNSPDVKRAVVVDWDPEFIAKFAMNYEQNNGSLKDARTMLVYMDAVEFLRVVNETFDTIIIDLPDPDDACMQGLYFTIIRSIPRVMHGNTEVLCHVGPVSLCKEHPNWKFIAEFRKEIHYNVDLYSRYIPSFSHEWGVLHVNLAEYTRTIHIPKDIQDIYLYMINGDDGCDPCEICDDDVHLG